MVRERSRRWIGAIVAVLLGASLLLVLAWPRYAPLMGRALISENRLEPSDAIVVLGSARIERTFEAGELYREGWAPLVILSPNDSPGTAEMLKRAGVQIPTYSESQRSALQQMGVPADAIVGLPGDPSSTADEAALVTALARQNGFERVIVVTSRYHTERAGIYFRRAGGDDLRVIIRGSRYDPSNPERWWSRPGERIDVVFEYLKLPKAWTYPRKRLLVQTELPKIGTRADGGARE